MRSTPILLLSLASLVVGLVVPKDTSPVDLGNVRNLSLPLPMYKIPRLIR